MQLRETTCDGAQVPYYRKLLSGVVRDLVLCSSEQISTKSPVQHISEPTVAAKLVENTKTVFGLSIPGYCRNKAVQHGGVFGNGLMDNVDTNGSY